jgi:hypothetical protein
MQVLRCVVGKHHDKGAMKFPGRAKLRRCGASNAPKRQHQHQHGKNTLRHTNFRQMISYCTLHTVCLVSRAVIFIVSRSYLCIFSMPGARVGIAG